MTWMTMIRRVSAMWLVALAVRLAPNTDEDQLVADALEALVEAWAKGEFWEYSRKVAVTVRSRKGQV